MDKVIIEETLEAPIEVVWQALTDKDEMKKWYFDLPEFKAEVGFTFQFEGQGNTGKKYLHLCEVTQVKLHELLEYSWTYKHIEGFSVVIFSLTQLSENKTQLKLIHSGLDTFPRNNSDFSSESFKGGWTELITNFLKNHLIK